MRSAVVFIVMVLVLVSSAFADEPGTAVASATASKKSAVSISSSSLQPFNAAATVKRKLREADSMLPCEYSLEQYKTLDECNVGFANALKDKVVLRRYREATTILGEGGKPVPFDWDSFISAGHIGFAGIAPGVYRSSGVWHQSVRRDKVIVSDTKVETEEDALELKDGGGNTLTLQISCGNLVLLKTLEGPPEEYDFVFVKNKTSCPPKECAPRPRSHKSCPKPKGEDIVISVSAKAAASAHAR